MDDQKRIATIRVRNGADPDDPTPNKKYFLDDHLGSLINREEYYSFGETSFGSLLKNATVFAAKNAMRKAAFNPPLPVVPLF